jgi:nucleoid DNA-binding protein
MAKAAAKKSPTKSEIYASIAEATGLNKKDVASVFDALVEEIKKSLGPRGSGSFAVPGLMKIVKIRKPAQPARKGVPNPFKPGELMDVPAKPAQNRVKVRPLKNLKEMVQK